ncbi:hypothetical protein ONR75_18955 [Rhodopseudomonas sp. P2A-2r]|uniref:hypothetical protein n=1 Tax=Rhodopseudomonas sp. P2A-2r TaxID=2991972 RepID=UPI002234CCC2|nr:hypothetical protein [Rhodopseudomonas sp. P2A-2r]UZE47072.1 hypothetical protein ONR75_18955 [Rhodopseudomonas sp. P2A-2r]
MHRKLVVPAIIMSVALTSPAFAIKISVKKAFKATLAVIAPPILLGTLAADAIKGDRLGETYNKVPDIAGDAIEKAAEVYQKANDIVYKLPREAIRSTLGEDWVTAFNILTASERIKTQIASTSGKYLGKCVGGEQCEVKEVVAIPVAAALKDAYGLYIQNAKPFEPSMVQVLSHAMPGGIVTSARWVVAKTPDFTFPGFYNFKNSVSGARSAVTIGNLIILSELPDFTHKGDWSWILHELHHSEQYAAFGEAPWSRLTASQ